MSEYDNYEEDVVDSALDTTEEVVEETDEDSSEETSQNDKETPEQKQSRLRRTTERQAKKAGVSVEEYLGIAKPDKSTNRSQEARGDVPEWGQKLLESEQKRTFQSDHGLTPETVDAVFRANGGKMPTEEQMESDDLIKTVVKSYQSKARVASNTPRGGSTVTYKGKTYADVVTSKESTPQDKQAAFEAARKKHGIK